jgi:hypothetical protein
MKPSLQWMDRAFLIAVLGSLFLMLCGAVALLGVLVHAVMRFL